MFLKATQIIVWFLLLAVCVRCGVKADPIPYVDAYPENQTQESSKQAEEKNPNKEDK